MELQASSHRSFPWTPGRIPRVGTERPYFCQTPKVVRAQNTCLINMP